MLICFDLREVGVEGQISGHGGRHAELRVETYFAVGAAGAEPNSGRVVRRLDGAREDVRPELDRVVARHITETGDVTGVEQVVNALRAAPRSPEILLVLA